MDSISKILCLILVLLLQLKGKITATPILPTKVSVEITNKLNMKHLIVNCKDKHNNLGVIELYVNETYTFRFYPNYIFPQTLYFCHFTWLYNDHHFDIYVEYRDLWCTHNVCSWEIFENGPCKIKPESRQCFSWDKVYAKIK
ncbi:uncharacterized protein HKW66_Vig0256930 [Vigna angularis]|uniref:S-protein homolog n=1 Tax=Phaseolus angularis TaxID=3914 RepID=A0A8T0JU76_PHAAN|nr:uncharacterized protein HKW66_Vig0256930 [Vigna angularis]